MNYSFFEPPESLAGSYVLGSRCDLFFISLVFGPTRFFRIILRITPKLMMNQPIHHPFARVRMFLSPIHYCLQHAQLDRALILIRNENINVCQSNEQSSVLHQCMEYYPMVKELLKRKDLVWDSRCTELVTNPKRLSLSHINPLHYMMIKQEGNVKTIKLLLKRFPKLLNSYSHLKEKKLRLHTVHIASIFCKTITYLKCLMKFGGKSLMNTKVKRLGHHPYENKFPHNICEGDTILHIMMKTGRPSMMIKQAIRVLKVNTKLVNTKNVRFDEIYSRPSVPHLNNNRFRNDVIGELSKSMLQAKSIPKFNNGSWRVRSSKRNNFGLKSVGINAYRFPKRKVLKKRDEMKDGNKRKGMRKKIVGRRNYVSKGRRRGMKKKEVFPRLMIENVGAPRIEVMRKKKGRKGKEGRFPLL